MNSKHLRIFLVLICSVILLLIVSARIGTKPPTTVNPNNPGTSLDNPEDFVEPTPTPTPEVEVTPTPDPYPDLPDVSVNDWQYKILNNIMADTGSFYPEVVEIENDAQYFDVRAIDSLRALLQAARDEGFEVVVRQGYRSYDTQRTIFFGRASIIHENEGIEYAQAEMQARKVVAYPGTSDHQTGLGVDLIDSKDTSLVAEEVENMPLLIWLKENCADYGFVMRYPEDKKALTGWYEPWHFRYVGEEVAQFMTKYGLCLEEFSKLYYR